MKTINKSVYSPFYNDKNRNNLTCNILLFCLVLTCEICSAQIQNRKAPDPGKPISTDLFGIFFEDINYAADGGLYAELIQNRSFEYSPGDKSNWNPFTSWELVKEGYGLGTVSVDTSSPVQPGNPHYVTLNVEKGGDGVGLRNSGFDGISLKKGENYIFSVYARQVSGNSAPLEVKLISQRGKVYSLALIPELTKDWKKYTVIMKSDSTDSYALIQLVTKSPGILNLDMISLFPVKTFHNRKNGMREDLSRVIADLKPKFVRFPGGCLVHGDGLNNLYRWKNTIGPVEQRIEQPDIWGYHQSLGLGFFEYFQFCEDIGAKPLPVVAAAVSCQNSGGSWRVGGTGQRGIPLTEMNQYINDVLDLIEYANGPVTSAWGSKRAESGHPASFHLEYIGIGNEDKQTPEFRERFKLIFDAVKLNNPKITVIGTVGPSPKGEDFDLGWKFATELNIPVVDEHYYMNPGWFIKNQKRYDTYNRSDSKVYIGEYASEGNAWINALSEAAFMTSIERNGDVVQLASYAPLLAKEGHTQWNPDLIYFNNTSVCPTVNYYVQQLFSVNQGDIFYDHIFSYSEPDNTLQENDSTLAFSCVKDSKTGDVILKLVNTCNQVKIVKINLTRFGKINPIGVCTVVSGAADAKNTFSNPLNIYPKTTDYKVSKFLSFETLPLSVSMIRIKPGRNLNNR
jgi:alpha-N-arabinofuranosidase